MLVCRYMLITLPVFIRPTADLHSAVLPWQFVPRQVFISLRRHSLRRELTI
jgi:hypothetical protein